jgi:hypothetical protein
MKRGVNPYEGNKAIIEDEATYEDYNIILLINLIAEIIVKITLDQSQPTQDPNTFQKYNELKLKMKEKGLLIVTKKRGFS